LVFKHKIVCNVLIYPDFVKRTVNFVTITYFIASYLHNTQYNIDIPSSFLGLKGLATKFLYFDLATPLNFISSKLIHELSRFNDKGAGIE